MKRVAVLIAVGLAGLLAGCNSDGVEFNGVQQIDQFPIRKTPIVHYKLPSEVVNQVTGESELDVTTFTAINLMPTAFTEQATPGHDLWSVNIFPTCTDNPTCPPPNTPVPDFIYTTMTYKSPGPNWPDATVTSSGIPAYTYIGGWTLSLQHQWFLRDVDGTALASPAPGTPPVQYESVSFSSMAISIVEVGQQTTPGTQLPVSGQQETIPAAPTGVGLNGIEQIVVPASNFYDIAYNGEGAPQGLLAAAWHEAPAENRHIETSFRILQGVPVPDYFGGGGPIASGGGIYHKRFSDNWQQTTSGPNSTLNIDDGVYYSYYLAVVGNHLIGYGVGLIDSSFAIPGVVNNQEDIMNLSVVLDMTAFIAAGKEFQFVVEDLLRMQDTVNGDWQNPGLRSTLPGAYR